MLLTYSDHELLVAKLKYYGVSRSALGWFNNYLLNQNQKLSSEKPNITCGIPQGSVLGPQLFTKYMADLHTSVNHSIKIHEYAGDTQLCIRCSVDNVPSMAHQLNVVLQRLLEQSRRHCLIINPNVRWQ